MSERIPCKRCLLSELNNEKAIAIVKEYKAGLMEELRCGQPQYEERLALCKACKYLHQGTCTKNGSYVEAFAFHINKHCPIGKGMW